MHICWLCVGVKGYRVWCEKSRRVITSTNVKFDYVEPPIASEATKVDNDMYQPLELTSHNVQRSKRHVKSTKRYIEECDYVPYALTIASEVQIEDDLRSYKEAMSIANASKWFGVVISRDGIL